MYCATKFAVEGLSEALHEELKPLGIHTTVVEPDYSRTDFPDASSLIKSERVIEDYDATSGAVRRFAAYSHNQPGEPVRMAAGMITLVDSTEPPLRLALGSDTLAAIAEKNAYVEHETKARAVLSASTDFPN